MLEVSETGLRGEIYTTLLRSDIIYNMGRQEGQRERPSNYYDPHHLFMVSTLKKKKKSLYYFMNKSHCKLHQKKKERERKGEF